MSFFINSENAKPTSRISLWAWLLLALPQLVWAIGSSSGTIIENFATVDYVIGTSLSTSASSNTVRFVVDKKVNLVVTETTGKATQVHSGQQKAVTTFTVTNLGNDPQGFNLAAVVATDTTSGVETVYADAGGVIDTARDGQHSAYATGPVVALTKSIVSVQPAIGNAVQNPLDGDPALRPSSVITYQIVARFTGVGTIDNLVITDPMPAETTYVPNSIKVDGIAKTDSAADADNADFTSNTITVSHGTVNTPFADILIQFKATIN